MCSDYSTNYDYPRVMPRDLFNESKLLKCLGLLTLKILNGQGLGISHSENNEPFRIGFMNDGFLVVSNISFDLNEIDLLFRSTYNSKNNYTLVCTYDYEDIPVFDESGEFTEEFIELISSLS